MSFLAPLFLLGALAVVGPLIFHLVRHSTRERMVFSSLMFLRSAPPQLSQRSRLEHLLLLLLRCLALALLALGFARPFLQQSFNSDSGAPQAKRTLVLVDMSASMRRAGLWVDARARAEAVVRQATPADQVAVFTFGQTVNPLVSFEEWQATPAGERVALVVNHLAVVSPGWGATQLDTALINAAEALAEKDESGRPAGLRQIVLISDVQAGSRLDALQSYEWPKGIELVVEAIKAHNATNAGLELLADAADADRQAPVSVRIRVTNSADSSREQFQVGWAQSAGGDFAGLPVNVYVPPGQSRVVVVPLPPPGLPAERIVLRGDDEDFDNTVYVISPEQRQLTAVYLGAEAATDINEPLFFLQRALPNTPRFGVKLAARAPSAGLTASEAQTAGLFFVTDSLPADVAGVLRQEMLGGKTVIFAPKTAAAATFAQLLGLERVALEEAQPGNYAMLAEIDFRHPLFAAFADPRFSDFTKIHIWKYRRVTAGDIPGARVLAKFDSGDPALLEIPVGQGRVLALMTSWQPADSQLAISSKFVPLLYAVLDLAGGLTPAPAQYFVGDEIPLQQPPTGQGATSTTVRSPDGTTVTLATAATRFKEALQPGIYQLMAGSQTVRLGINLAAAESRTAPLAPEELERFGAPVLPPAPEAARAAQRVLLLQSAEVENRQKFWRWFIGATLAVLLVESLLAGWTARRTAIPGGSAS